VTDLRYSTAYSPLVLITCPARFEADSTRRVLDAYTREVLHARKTIVLVVDATVISELPSAGVRKAITDWIVPVEELGARYMLGMAMATSNVLARGAMTAINWVVPPKVPMTFVATMREAVSWGVERLSAASIPITPELTRYAESLAGEGSPSKRAQG
jgi:hypothetical protein